MRNKKGFTLIELMIAMVIILISLLGMYKTVLVAMEGNMKNVMRDEGKLVAQQVMNEIRGLPFDKIIFVEPSPYTWTDDDLQVALGMESYDDPNDGSSSPVPRILVRSRNAEMFYKVAVTIWDKAPLKQVRVVVGWDVKLKKDRVPTEDRPTGKEFEHSLSTMVGEI